MWMSQYITEIQRQLIVKYGLKERDDMPGVPAGPVPDGEYPMMIDGKLDKVRIKNGKINHL
jgi:hypothetical protein